MKRAFLTYIILIFTLTLSVAEELTFVTTAPKAVVAGQNFRLSYTVNTNNVKDHRIPTIKDFTILSGPHRSTEMQMSNVQGQESITRTVTFNYTLLADKEGEFTIPGATVTADGKELTSNTVKVNVLPRDTQQTTSEQQSNQRNRSSSSSNNTSTVSNEELFITATLSKTNVYEQEAVLLTYKVFSLVNLTSLNGKMPDLKGFHTQEVNLPQQKEWSLEHHNGRNYRALTWRQYVLFPQQSGEIEIPSVAFEGIIVKQVRTTMDPFEAFFNGGMGENVEIKKELKTPALKLRVEQLPSGRPASFMGGVGEFSITSSISTEQLKTNEAVTLRIVISGAGNMKLIKTPDIEFPKDFEVYDPKIENNFTLKANGLSGNKIIEYLAIPRHAGTYTIPEVKFSYFDIKTKQYKTIQTDAYTINVEKGSTTENSNAVSGFVSKEELKMLGQDIRFIKKGEATYTKSNYLFSSISYILFYIIPFIAFILFIIIYRKKMADNMDTTILRTKKANKVAIKRLKQSKRLLEEQKKNEFYDEILKTIWGYTSDKLSIPVSLLSKENVASELSEKGIEDTLIKELELVLSESEFARYAPGDSGEAMDKIYNMAINVISKMENSIKK